MNTKRFLTAGSALVLALSVASPALAHDGNESDRKEHKLGISIGALLKGDRGDDDKRGEKHATSTIAISGTVSALSGSTITVTGEKGATYTVNAANAIVNGSSQTSALSQIQVGDRIVAKGSLSGSVMTATKINDSSLRHRLALVELNGVRAGTVASIAGNMLSIDRFGTGTTSVTTNASTFYLAGGAATTSGALSVGSKILVLGPTTTGTTDSITASVIVLLQHGANFFKGLFR